LAVFAAGAFLSGDGAGVLSVCAKAGCAVIARASRETQAKAFVAAMRLPLGMLIGGPNDFDLGLDTAGWRGPSPQQGRPLSSMGRPSLFTRRDDHAFIAALTASAVIGSERTRAPTAL
jgi:hypothetical protein